VTIVIEDNDLRLVPVLMIDARHHIDTVGGSNHLVFQAKLVVGEAVGAERRQWRVAQLPCKRHALARPGLLSAVEYQLAGGRTVLKPTARETCDQVVVEQRILGGFH